MKITEEKNYASSIRPHIIAKHFLKYPELENEIIFYHDCDIIFRELPPLLNALTDNSWYVPCALRGVFASQYYYIACGDGKLMIKTFVYLKASAKE